jgi:hypothetical protein
MAETDGIRFEHSVIKSTGHVQGATRVLAPHAAPFFEPRGRNRRGKMDAVQMKRPAEVESDELFAVEGGFAQLAPVAAGGGALLAGASAFAGGVVVGIVGNLVYDHFFGQRATANCDETSAEASTDGAQCDCQKP